MSKNKYENFIYSKQVQDFLDIELTPKQTKRLEKISNRFSEKNISKNYQCILRDVFILFEIQNFTTNELSDIYNVSIRTIQKWVKDLELKKTKTISVKKEQKKEIHKTIITSDLPELVEDFLNYLESIKGKSENTILAYKTDLKLFFRIMKILKGIESEEKELKLIKINDIDADFINSIKLRDLYSFLKYIDKFRNNNSHAKARKVATLKSFYNFLHLKLKVIKENPAAELESPKIEKRHPVYLSLDQSLQLLDSLDKTNVNYYRDYCILTLFLNCGLRLSELCSIEITKINKDTLTVIGKGNKERTIYLNNSCILAINNYLSVRDSTKVNISDKNKLFISRQNRAINKMTVENIVKKHIKNAGINDRNYSPHKLRHTAATLMYKHGNVDIRTLQSILGHESVSTTQIYTHLDDDTLRAAANLNPLSNINKKIK